MNEDTFEDFLARLENFPQWWTDLKRKSWARFHDLPMPARSDENWRFASIGSIGLDGYNLGGTPHEDAKMEILARSSEIREYAGKMVFADDNLLLHEPVSEGLARQGVIWLPIEKALSEHGELLKKHFMAQEIKLGSEKFSSLHSALCTAGSLLYVPNGVEIEAPLVACHWSSGANSSVFPHTLVIAESHAKAQLVDLFHCREKTSRNFVCGVNDIYAGPGSNVTYISAQNWSENTLSFHLNSTQAFRDSFVTSLNVNLGGKQARTESHSQVLGEGAHSGMFSLTVGDRKQEFDQRTLQTHAKGHSVSDLLYKNALLGEARTIFSGLIKVEKEAQQTDAYQTNRNLLLSDAAEANSLPGLEILANDVKCSHGATTGQIDRDQLYYMLSRGIPEVAAKELLIFGFFEEILLKLENKEIANTLREHIRKKLFDKE